MNVNQRIKKYLEEHGITQMWLSNKTGISYKTVNDIVNNVTTVSAINLGKISKALGVSADIFLE
jgi:plasmid maintenance system antidote protein VapI